MFTLVTGTPGSGKTLWTINHLKDGLKLPHSTENRKVYYYGIPELSSNLGWIKLTDPENWHLQVTDGSIVVIDECQEHYPVRPAKNPVPDGLKAIEKHRHRGLDLFFMTQHPSLLDHHARRLVGEHCHLKRNFGAPFSVLYRSNECMDNPKDYHTLQKAEKTTFKYPKSTFDLYKSAEVHTHKFRMPKIVYLLCFMILFVLAMVFWFIDTLFSDDKVPPSSSKNYSSTGSLINGLTGKQDNNPNLSVNSFIPKITNIPASSQYYSKQWKPKSIPIVSSCMGTIKYCTCYTQQGTKVQVTLAFCLSVLKNGSQYDHTLKDNRTKNKNDKFERD